MSAPCLPHVIALTLSYDGTPFSGFARQHGLPTVQGEVEEALQIMLRREVRTVGAGRTDAGVHALGQVMSFEADGTEPDPASMLRSLNALTRREIVITNVQHAAPSFDARRSALSREYRYRIVSGAVPPLFLAPYAWWVPRGLDLERMERAAAYLVGEHDFRSFCVTGSAKGIRTVRRLDLIEVFSESILGEESVTVRLVGNAFLHSMVRVVVGSLVEVGSGRRPVQWMEEVLAARRRSAAGPTAPAHGLTLWHVSYPEGCWVSAPGA